MMLINIETMKSESVLFCTTWFYFVCLEIYK